MPQETAELKAQMPETGEPQWQRQVEDVLRFPGMDPTFPVFDRTVRVSERAIAMSLRAMDVNGNVASNWVPVAMLVMEIQKCCLRRAVDLDVGLLPMGWNDISDDWCNDVLADIARGPPCYPYIPYPSPDLVRFVFWYYLNDAAWLKYGDEWDREEYKRIMTLNPGSIPYDCAKMARGFSEMVREARRSKVERLQLATLEIQVNVTVEDTTEFKMDSQG